MKEQGNKKSSILKIDLSNFGFNRFDKWLSIVLIVVILGAVATLTYLLIRQQNEKYTEFYVLGVNGQAADYPTEFTLENGDVSSVQYSSTSNVINEPWGRVVLGIINDEGRDTSYSVSMQINGTSVQIPFQGTIVNQIGPIALSPKVKWEQQIGIIPLVVGDKEKVEIFLFKDNNDEPYLDLTLSINVK